MGDTPLDEMIKVYDLRRGPIPSNYEPGVRLVPYSNVEEIPNLVCAHPAMGPSSFPSDESGSLLPDDNEIRGLQTVEGITDSTEIEQFDIGDDQEHDLEADAFLSTEMQPSMPSAMPVTLELITPSEDELRAASVIQQAYRRVFLRRRRDATIVGLLAARRRFFSICFDKSQEMAWKDNSYYRRLFLGPLPHILLCLDATQAAILSQKKITKKHLLHNRHEELDELGPKLTELA